MRFDHLTFSFFIITILIPSTTSTPSCNHTCGNHNLQFPFGFSSGCQIRLNCTSNGTITASDLAVHSVTGDTILVNLPATCSRPVEALRRLFTANFAPTSENAILLLNCGSQSNECFIPTAMVEAHFGILDCGGKSGIGCYSETDKGTSFVDYGNLTRSGCRNVLSAMSMESPEADGSSVSLDVQIVRLGWWVRGECRCSKNAECFSVSPPMEGKPPAYRCRCVEGYAGDGFVDGVGCHKESLSCNPSNYLSGKCGGTTRVVVSVGGVAVGASLMVSLGLVLCFVRKRSKSRTSARKRREICKTIGIKIPIHPYKEMEKATDSFSDKRRLGIGAYGTVYSGKLNSDEWVAIKRIKHRDDESIEQVVNEIKLLSSVSHPNLVRLLGCSIDNGEQILVYEFMPNGTLSQHLQRQKGSGLPWPIRLAIAAETAQAISYLHNAMHPPIYHRDIKSSNILLDYNFKSKVADFGLSRLGLTTESSHVSTAPQGTPGYLDPQYHQHFHLSDKSDVYSFGVVLIEIITALRVVDFGRPQNEVNLAALAVDRIGKGSLDEIIDPLLQHVTDDPSTNASIHKVAELAFRCLSFHRDMRPSMMEVAMELEQIKLSICSSASSMETIIPAFSPVSVEDSWQSDQTSPSSNTLLNSIN